VYHTARFACFVSHPFVRLSYLRSPMNEELSSSQLTIHQHEQQMNSRCRIRDTHHTFIFTVFDEGHSVRDRRHTSNHGHGGIPFIPRVKSIRASCRMARTVNTRLAPKRRRLLLTNFHNFAAPRFLCRPRRLPPVSGALIATLWLAFVLSTALCHGQQPAGDTVACPPTAQSAGAQQPSGAVTGSDCQTDQSKTTADHGDRVDDRIFGVVPNYGTVKKASDVPPITNPQTLKLAALDSFDPYVYPFVGVLAGLAQFQHQNPSFGTGVRGYAKRYATSFADNTIGNFLVEAVLPIALREDARYFQDGTGSVWHRFGYAASRVVVGRNLEGHRRLNLAEIGGNGMAAGLSNVYRPAADRSMSTTLDLWATQIMWDAIGNVAKEFWPDIHKHLHRHPPQP
jgi:hypothetical protein